MRPPATSSSAPGLEVLLVSDELPEADKNPTATYLAQRTQLGSGNTRKAVAPRNRTSSIPTLKHAGTAQGNSLTIRPRPAGKTQDEQVLTTIAWSTSVRYLAEAGERRHGARPAAADRPAAHRRARPRRAGPGTAARAAARRAVDHPGHPRGDARAVPGRLAPQGRAHRHPQLPDRGARGRGRRAARWSRSASPPTASSTACVIRRSSGSPELDQAALEILKLASPFDPFPPELARQVPACCASPTSGSSPAAAPSRDAYRFLETAPAMPILEAWAASTTPR